MKVVKRFLFWIFFEAERKEKKVTGREPRWAVLLVVSAIAVVLVLASSAVLQFNFVKSWNLPAGTEGLAKYGISGDFFGFANALFSALAFAILIVTLWMQKHELSQQRQELDQTQEIMKLQVDESVLQREELQNQKQEMQLQNESVRRQIFENTFFGLLQMHGDVVAAIKPENGQPAGREAFSHLFATLRDFPVSGHSHTHRRRKGDLTVSKYEEWYSNYEAHVGHYFRTLYNLFRYVDEQGGSQREMYSRLVRAQLSSNELQLLLYNGLSRYGKDKFKPLIEKYTLLKHLKKTDENKDAREGYAPTAFEKASDMEEA